ncbi:hypothetical protein FRC12_002606 [Ceratobasidium sp. 428]|nr:hypothetical protein FRC09_017614 [Ceratobasidium sp. 395]KAG8796227.1 hypothetical protein FRC12_002606 [Ceratobasidium sp. 428]
MDPTKAAEAVKKLRKRRRYGHDRVDTSGAGPSGLLHLPPSPADPSLDDADNNNPNEEVTIDLDKNLDDYLSNDPDDYLDYNLDS